MPHECERDMIADQSETLIEPYNPIVSGEISEPAALRYPM
jgi:hypothetical protein